MITVILYCWPYVAFCQQVDFYHGTDYACARWLYENQLTPCMLELFGTQSAKAEEPWRNYSDFGKGFYTHLPGQFDLARAWAIRVTLWNCQPGQYESRWGVVILHVDPHLLEPLDSGSAEKVLYFPEKSSPAWNAPPSTWSPGMKMNWLEFVVFNRHLSAILQLDDYDWSSAYAWIQGPIWVPRDSGLGVGPPLFAESIQQRNWLEQGRDQVLNNPKTTKDLVWGTIRCSASDTR
jgi:hypothetical protein